MKFVVESWRPEYGSPIDSDVLEQSTATVDLDVETVAAQWTPRTPQPVPGIPTVLFVDGVRRIDARVWLQPDAGPTMHLGICATYAAGIARCDGRARIVETQVGRGLFTAAAAQAIATSHGPFLPYLAKGGTVEQLSTELQTQMRKLEDAVTHNADAVDLVVIDGPLRGPRRPAHAIGYVKTHDLSYLPPESDTVIAALGSGERTPLFLINGSWSRYSWYLRLPGTVGHPWACIVRGEIDAGLPAADAIELADRASAILPRFASAPERDPRAPQNLYPIAGLERDLRRRSGDPRLMYRALLKAAGTVVPHGA